MMYIYATLISLFWITYTHIAAYGLQIRPIPVSPDGMQYVTMMSGGEVPLPYSLRWLIPNVIRAWVPAGYYTRVWWYISKLALVSLGPLMVYYLSPDTPTHSALLASALVVGLPGIVIANILMPILVDAPAVAIMLGSAGLFRRGHIATGLLLTLMGTYTKEIAPVFISAAVWWWLPLVCIIPVILHVLEEKAKSTEFADANFSEKGKAFLSGALGKLPGLNGHRTHLLKAKEMILPWGVCLLAAFYPSWQLAVILLLAYAQLAHGFDKMRLYQWAFPCVIEAAIQAIPKQWVIPAILVHWFHPWNGRCA